MQPDVLATAFFSCWMSTTGSEGFVLCVRPFPRWVWHLYCTTIWSVQTVLCIFFTTVLLRTASWSQISSSVKWTGLMYNHSQTESFPRAHFLAQLIWIQVVRTFFRYHLQEVPQKRWTVELILGCLTLWRSVTWTQLKSCITLLNFQSSPWLPEDILQPVCQINHPTSTACVSI